MKSSSMFGEEWLRIKPTTFLYRCQYCVLVHMIGTLQLFVVRPLDGHSSSYQNPSSYYSRNGDFTATLAVSALGCPGGVTKTRYQYIYLTRYPLMGIKISASAAPSYGCDLSLSASLYLSYIVLKHSPKVAMNEAFNGGLRSFNQNQLLPREVRSLLRLYLAPTG